MRFIPLTSNTPFCILMYHSIVDTLSSFVPSRFFRRALILSFNLACSAFNVPRVFSSSGNRNFNNTMAITSVTIFSGVSGIHRNARYALATAIIHPILNSVPRSSKMYAHPFVIPHAIPRHNNKRGFAIN